MHGVCPRLKVSWPARGRGVHRPLCSVGSIGPSNRLLVWPWPGGMHRFLPEGNLSGKSRYSAGVAVHRVGELAVERIRAIESDSVDGHLDRPRRTTDILHKQR